MRRRFASLGALLTVLGVWPLPPASAEPPAPEPACAEVTASARNYGYGYQHLVTLSNHCARAVRCEVWTNVDPTPHHELSAKPGESASVATRLSSPSREVSAGHSCRFALDVRRISFERGPTRATESRPAEQHGQSSDQPR